MNIETVLNATLKAYETCAFLHWNIGDEFSKKRYRQLTIFKERILREAKRDTIERIEDEN